MLFSLWKKNFQKWAMSVSPWKQGSTVLWLLFFATRPDLGFHGLLALSRTIRSNSGSRQDSETGVQCMNTRFFNARAFCLGATFRIFRATRFYCEKFCMFRISATCNIPHNNLGLHFLKYPIKSIQKNTKTTQKWVLLGSSFIKFFLKILKFQHFICYNKFQVKIILVK